MSFDKPMAYHIDGEGKPPVSEFKIKLLPASIQMLVPANSINKV